MNQKTFPWLLVGLALGYYLRGYESPQGLLLQQQPLQPLSPGLFSRLSPRGS